MSYIFTFISLSDANMLMKSAAKKYNFATTFTVMNKETFLSLHEIDKQI